MKKICKTTVNVLTTILTLGTMVVFGIIFIVVGIVANSFVEPFTDSKEEDQSQREED